MKTHAQERAAQASETIQTRFGRYVHDWAETYAHINHVPMELVLQSIGFEVLPGMRTAKRIATIEIA